MNPNINELAISHITLVYFVIGAWKLLSTDCQFFGMPSIIVLIRHKESDAASHILKSYKTMLDSF